MRRNRVASLPPSRLLSDVAYNGTERRQSSPYSSFGRRNLQRRDISNMNFTGKEYFGVQCSAQVLDTFDNVIADYEETLR